MYFKASESLAEQAASYISEKIVYFDLKPGERIIEESLAHELGVSRSPVREALRILQKKWLIELIPRKEARVSVITEDMIMSIGEILKSLYGMATRRAVKTGTPQDIINIGLTLDYCQSFLKKNDIIGYFKAIIKLESVCLEAAKNPVFNGLLRDLWPYSRRVQFATMQLRAESLENHFNLFREAYNYLVEGKGELSAETIERIAGAETKMGIKYLPQFSNL